MENTNRITIREVLMKLAPLNYASGFDVSEQDIDGLLIKRLTASNVLDSRENTNQTHIAITGNQMNMFPSIYIRDYVEGVEPNTDLKKYMYMFAPCNLSEINLNYLDETENEDSTNKMQRTKFSIVRSRRKDSFQIEIGHTSMSDKKFIDFRKKIHVDDYLIMMKLLDKIEYIAFAIRKNDFEKLFSQEELKKYNGCFAYKKTSTGTAADIEQLTIHTGEKTPFQTRKQFPLPHNRILFGAPGTGKSHQLREEQNEFFDDSHYERVTFHPAYSYAQFFGSYKPVSEGKDISYEFVCGPFLRILLKALKNPSENYLLIIEEINRADVAAVFGDVFQLLDREDGESEYKIDIPEDLDRYLHQSEEYQSLCEAGGALGEGKLYLPKNFYIWATMNSADQGVMPLDTAFKRRWSFTYLPINNNEDKALYQTPSADREKPAFVWQEIRKIINGELAKIEDIAEDRWIGPFFLKKEDFDTEERFKEVFKSKVLMYLYQDIAKYARPGEIFAKPYNSYSQLCDDFDAKGMAIFAGQDKDDAE